MHALNNVFSLLGLAGFAVVWFFGDIYIATAFLMGIFTLQLAVVSAVTRKLHKPSFYLWLLVIVLGALTLLLREKAFIQMKTSVVYSVFACALLAGDYLGKNLPRLALGQFFAPPDAVWRRVSHAAAGYFLLLALCNYFTAKYLSESAWVAIKTFGFPAATFIFTVLLLLYLYRYARQQDSA